MVMNIASSPTRDKYPLSTRKIAKKTLVGSLAWIIIIAILYPIIGVSFLYTGSTSDFITTTLVCLLILGIVCGITYAYQYWYFMVYYYDLNQDYIVIKKGPITPREITIPYERVQDVYVDQDIFDRLFGIYDVHLSSATISSGMEAHIDGVEKEGADGLRQLLLETVSKKLNRTAPPPPAPRQ